jgi:hypothetical protein
MRGGLDAGLLAGVHVDQLDLVAARARPSAVHALQHLGPVLAFGAAGAGIDFDVGVVVVGLAGEQRRTLSRSARSANVFSAATPSSAIASSPSASAISISSQVSGQLAFDGARGRHRLIEPAALAHHRLRGLGIVPERRVLDARVQFIETAEGAIPVKETSSAGPAPA